MVTTSSAYLHSANFKKYNRPVKKIKVNTQKAIVIGDVVNPSSLTFRSLNKAQTDLNEKQQVIRQEFIEGNNHFANKIQMQKQNEKIYRSNLLKSMTKENKFTKTIKTYK